MSYKFLYLYLAAGTIALLLLLYQLVAYYPDINTRGIWINIIPIVLFYFLAYKILREKQDKDMM